MSRNMCSAATAVWRGKDDRTACSKEAVLIWGRSVIELEGTECDAQTVSTGLFKLALSGSKDGGIGCVRWRLGGQRRNE